MRLLVRLALRMGLLVWLAALAGCASTRLIDSEVRSFRSANADVAASSYQFERLPSQQADAAAQTQREQWALKRFCSVWV